MIYTWQHVKRSMQLEADVCVIGSGAGGAAAAARLASLGKRVALLEAGSFWQPKDFNQIEYDCFQRLYHNKAGRTTVDKAVHVHQGKGVGGSTLHNLNLCARLPHEVFASWRERFGLSALNESRLDALYEEVESRLAVQPIAESQLNANNLALKRACESLGYRGGMLRHNRVGCVGSGYCELGCAFDAKQNAAKVFVPEAVNHGAVVLADTWATQIGWIGRSARTVSAHVRHPESGERLYDIAIDCRAVCVSASATSTPALLLRSQVPDPNGLVGSRLHLHPGAAVAGIFPEPMFSWTGIPQSYECTEFLDFSPASRHRVWILPAFAHPAGVSSLLAGFGADHARYLSIYPRLGAFSAMVHDETRGSVRPHGLYDVAIDYWPDEADRRQLADGLRTCAHLLLTGGASRALVSTRTVHELASKTDVDGFFDSFDVRPHELDVTAVHPMSSVWMGDRAIDACVDSRGRYHHLDNLFVADTSLFPTSIGVPPQLTTYALGLHVGEQIADLLG